MSVLVTKKAPDFTAAAVLPDGTIKEDFKLSDLKGKYVVLFFYPLDFTFVCQRKCLLAVPSSQLSTELSDRDQKV